MNPRNGSLGTQYAGPARRWAEKHPLAVIGIVLFLLLAPFLDKAVHIDDPLFVWTAQHILKHSGDFYGFDVNWTGFTLPMSVEDWNPPTTSYYLAGVAALFGWREIVLHSAMMLVAFAAAAGIFQLAKIWCERPLLATLIAMSTPVFLVSATTLMCDVPMLAIWVWTVVVWERALKDGGTANYFFAALLAGLSVLTKYSAVTLLPLLPILGLMRKRRLGWWLLWLALPVAMIGLYQWGTAGLYGQGLISAAANDATESRSTGPGGAAGKIVIGLAFLGGCLLPVLFFAFRLWTRRDLIVGGGIILLSSAANVFASGTDGRFGLPFQLQMALLLAAGLQLVLLALVDLWRRRDAISLMLALWLGSGFVFAAMLNWTMSARSFLPLAPVAGILVVRAMRQRANRQDHWAWPLAISFGISLMLARADYLWANSARDAARQLASKYAPFQKHLWFEGHWGFQFYFQPSGATPVEFQRSVLSPGDILVMPSNNSNVVPPRSNDVVAVESPVFPACPWLSTFNARTGAGFYGVGGMLPFVLGPVPAEKYTVWRVLKPQRLLPPELLNNLAWQLATSADPKTRDGRQAVELARRACELTQYRVTVMVGTLAAAYAEAGQFDEAIATAQRACALASEQGQTELLRRNQELLELYRGHQAYHSP
ncbi:MAG: glycosyltransferase family 39 protein [Verrucomicrobiota bacterium]|jgi:4-amino-4-deoxy-L-arabinose transferase-like glycosyltransferase